MEVSTFAIIFILGVVFLFLIGVIILVIQNEKKKKKWLKNLDVGDECRYHTPSSVYPTGKVVGVSDDKYIVEFQIDKRWLYPPKKNGR